MKVIVTGAAGFIGFHLCLKLISSGYDVLGIDNLNDAYEVDLKKNRLKILEKKGLSFKKIDINQLETQKEKADVLINLAAQAGVRLNLKRHINYLESNVSGFHSVINFCKNNKIKNMIYASSSSVYDDESDIPFCEGITALKPKSFYGLTKLYNEKIAQIEAYNMEIKSIGLRFFSAYGPYGRPDMAYYLFTDSVNHGKEIYLNNKGDMMRDMTYIDDIVEGVIKSLNRINYDRSNEMHELFNLGNGQPIKTTNLLEAIQNKLEKSASITYTQSSNESKITHADINKSKKILGYNPKISFEEGIENFINWYKCYEKK